MGLSGYNSFSMATKNLSEFEGTCPAPVDATTTGLRTVFPILEILEILSVTSAEHISIETSRVGSRSDSSWRHSPLTLQSRSSRRSDTNLAHSRVASWPRNWLVSNFLFVLSCVFFRIPMLGHSSCHLLKLGCLGEIARTISCIFLRISEREASSW